MDEEGKNIEGNSQKEEKKVKKHNHKKTGTNGRDARAVLFPPWSIRETTATHFSTFVHPDAI